MARPRGFLVALCTCVWLTRGCTDAPPCPDAPTTFGELRFEVERTICDRCPATRGEADTDSCLAALEDAPAPPDADRVVGAVESAECIAFTRETRVDADGVCYAFFETEPPACDCAYGFEPEPCEPERCIAG